MKRATWLGRQTADAITTLATAFDNSVLRIQTAYNALGDPYLITSYNAATSGSIDNQVEEVYNGLNQLTNDYQAHSGAVSTSTSPDVQYTYVELAGGANNSRLESITYPDSYVVDYNYGTGLDSNISRLTSLSDTSGTPESYLYLGLDTVVQRTRTQINTEMTFISQTGGTGDAGDQYTGLDRFGRVAEVNWYNTSSSTSADDFQNGYDQDDNVLFKNNMLQSSDSELYHASGSGNGYDGLNPLAAFARGTLSASGGAGTPLDTVSSPTETESWTPDPLGNFSSITLNGTATSRTNNQQNETTAVGSASLAFNTNGDTTTDDQGHTEIYDAWNRLVEVKNGGTVLASYEYDGMGRRIQQTESSTTTDIYFDNQMRDIEEQISGTTHIRYVWSTIDQDAMVLRDSNPSGGVLTVRLWVQQDANWNVTSLVNTSGIAVERYIYDPYGAVTMLTGSWGSRSSSSYAWQYLFQAGRLDGVSGLYVFENRDYSVTLGRWLEKDPLRYSVGDNNLYRYVSNQPCDTSDPSGLAPPSWEQDFKASLKSGGVPQDIIDAIVSAANSMPNIRPRIFQSEHQACKEWVELYQKRLNDELRRKGYKNGIRTDAKQWISDPDVYFWSTHNWRDEEHTTFKLTVKKNGEEWYIDNGYVANSSNQSGHFAPASAIPTKWTQYQGDQPPPPAYVPGPTDIFGKDIYRDRSKY